MTVFEIEPLVDSRWADFVEQHPKSSVFHRAEWLNALKATYNYQPAAVTTCPPNTRLTNAIVFCRIRSSLTGNRLVSLPFSDHCEPLVNEQHELNALMATVKEEVDQRRRKYVEIRPVTAIAEANGVFAAHATYLFHRLDLRPGERELFRDFHKDCVQRKIRRAERESLRYEEGTSERLLNHFYRLLVMTRRKQGFPPQPLRWFRSLIASFGRALQICVALKGDRPMASILTLSHGKTITYKYGCSDVRFNNLGGTALLFWNTIRQAKAEGFEQLDLGRCETGNAGLATFKERLGAKPSLLTYWRYPPRHDIAENERALKLIKGAVSISPELPLIVAGRLLYRHIG